MTQKLAMFKQELDWLERMDVTCTAAPLTPREGEEDKQNGLDINNDFKREMLLWVEREQISLNTARTYVHTYVHVYVCIYLLICVVRLVSA